MANEAEGDAGVLRSKRNSTRYQILVEIAERQPAVSQQEVADAIGITAQAVSDYLGELVEQGFVDKEGRGRYQVTKEGVDWLITRTDELRTFVDHVAEDVLEEVDVDTAIANGDVREGETVSLAMRDGVLTAIPGEAGGATAVAVTDAGAGEDVGVTDFEGVLDYELGTVTVVSIPPVQDGGSAAVDPDAVVDLLADHDLLAVDSPEGLAAARRADLEPDVRFGTAEAVREAATKGLDVLVLAASRTLATHADRLREDNLSYEVVDAAER